MNIIVNKMTTGVACLRTIRSFIGIEKEEKYFKIASDRIRKEQDDVEQSLYYSTCDLQERGDDASEVD
jgi:DNA modification methylase